ncbi:MAG: quinolinate synthase NadA [Spirochaetota bacterium]
MNLNVIEALPEEYTELEYNKILDRISKAKEKLGKDLLILGHHYQMDEIIQFADKRGDSLALSKFAAEVENIKYVVFCGVHFMAEVADILTDDDVKVMLPDMEAGCTMAEMANIKDVESAWKQIKEINPSGKIIPITYINCDAKLKAFVGKNGGSICTSGNAEKIIKWAMDKGDKLFFFPDQHLGRNISYELGVPLENMRTWTPKTELGGNTSEDIKNAQLILWNGYCSVHTKFRPSHIDYWRKRDPEINIIVHPECNFNVTMNADYYGSTSKIIKIIDEAPKGSKWAVGTEAHLVSRLQKEYPDKFITNLSTFECVCGTMYRIRPPYLLYVLENLVRGDIINQISVEKDIAGYTKTALDKMFEITFS